MAFPKWAVDIAKIFRHQLDVVDGVHRFAASTMKPFIVVDWNKAAFAVQNKQANIWDMMKLDMMTGISLQLFSDSYSDYEAIRYYPEAAKPKENIIDFFLRTKT